MNKKIKIIAIIVLIGGGGYLAYSYIVAPSVTKTDASTSTMTDASTEAINQKFVQSLAGISNIQLDRSIFSNPAFSSLIDFSNPLNPEPNIGRPNPFMPIGSDEGVIVSSAPNDTISNTETITNNQNSLPAKPRR